MIIIESRDRVGPIPRVRLVLFIINISRVVIYRNSSSLDIGSVIIGKEPPLRVLGRKDT